MKYLLILFFFFHKSIYCEERNPPKVPWHFVNIWWNCNVENEDLMTFSMRIKINGDISNKDDIYIAPISGSINESYFYGGFQTNTGGWKSKKERIRKDVGYGGIFSRWKDSNQKSIDLTYTDGDIQTLFEAANYEGSFASVRKKIFWSNGFYRYEIRRVNSFGNLQYSWFEASLFNEQNNTSIPIGRLRFDGDHFNLKTFASFVEEYGNNKKDIPKMQISFMKPFINDKQCQTNSVYVVYPENGYKPYLRYANISSEIDLITVNISNEIISGEKKDITLKFKD